MSEFWDRIVQERNEHVIIDGRCYYIAPENYPLSCKGHGGRRFNIKFLETEQTITTTNLWYNGDVPEEYCDILVDNAKFVWQQE